MDVLDPFSLVAAEEEHERHPELGESVQRLPRATFRAFVACLVLAQAGLFAVSLGLLLVGFRGQATLGGGLVLGGGLALAATGVIYRRQERRA